MLSVGTKRVGARFSRSNRLALSGLQEKRRAQRIVGDQQSWQNLRTETVAEFRAYVVERNTCSSANTLQRAPRHFRVCGDPGQQPKIRHWG